MCDYSLEMYASRPARAGEQYQTTVFPSGSIGLVSPGDRNTAICIACDTRLVIEKVPAPLQESLGIGETANATFVSLPYGAYRDGLQFDNGKNISLQRVGSGVAISVAPPAEISHGVEREIETV